jgi:hypothetical protein
MGGGYLIVRNLVMMIVNQPLRKDSGLSSNTPIALTLQSTTGLKKRLIDCCKWGLFNYAGMQSGFLILCLLRRKILERDQSLY